MDDRTYEALRALVLDHLKWWLHYLGLEHWEWSVEWYRDVSQWPGTANEAGRSTIMQIDAHPQYLSLDLDVNMPALLAQRRDCEASFDDADEAEGEFIRRVESYIVHELCHCFLAYVRPPQFDEPVHRPWGEYIHHEEMAVTLLQKAFVWIANHGDERPRKVAQRKRERRQARERKRGTK